MHPFLTEPLVFGKPHPPWEEIWSAATNMTFLNNHRGKVHDDATGVTYPSVMAFCTATQNDDEPLPFAMNGDEPDYNHRLEF